MVTRDHLSSARDIVDAAGMREARLSYDPFGRIERSGSLSAFPVTFASYTTLSDGDLLMAPYRVHEPQLGRWISRDPLGPVDGPNVYAFVRGNPINYFDPTGLKISCLPSVTWKPVKVTTGCVERPDACAFISRIEGRPTECKEDCGKWKFDAYITMDVVVEYSIPLQTRNRQTPGATMEQHENLHVADYFGLCRDFNSLIKTKGFSLKPLCEAARQSLNDRIGWYTNDVLVRTRRHDSLPIR